ncbi:MAG: hypothetical protein AAFP03_15115 [Cyanobacteria bacterium J06598_3]
MQAYVELVQLMLNCPLGQEAAVLRQHQDLLDKGLLWVMAQDAGTLRQLGQENNANRLEHIAAQLAQAMDLNSTILSESPVSKDLQTILQALSQPPSDSRDTTQRVLLCQQALQMLVRQENKLLWAMLQFELGNSFTQNQQGDRAENIEAAITAYQQSLQVFTQEHMPVEWARSINNLAARSPCWFWVKLLPNSNCNIAHSNLFSCRTNICKAC